MTAPVVMAATGADSHAALMAAVEATRAETAVEPHQVSGESRADFQCATCVTIHTALPVQSKRCPVCERKRGFVRLYNGVQVSTKGRRIAKFIDPQMTRAFDAKSAQQSAAKRFEQEGNAALARAAAETGGTPPARVAPRSISAAGALGMIDPAGRASSRNDIMPVLKDLRVGPSWVKK